MWVDVGLLLWPNLVGSLEAPTTVSCGAVEKMQAAALGALLEAYDQLNIGENDRESELSLPT